MECVGLEAAGFKEGQLEAVDSLWWQPLVKGHSERCSFGRRLGA